MSNRQGAFEAPEAWVLTYGADPDVHPGRADVPDALASIIARSVQKDREQRLPDARAPYTALGRV